MKKNIVLLMTTVTVVAGLFTGCGNKTTNKTVNVEKAPVVEQVQAGTEEEITQAEAQVLKVFEDAANTETEEANAGLTEEQIEKYLDAIQAYRPVVSDLGAELTVYCTGSRTADIKVDSIVKTPEGYELTVYDDNSDYEMTYSCTEAGEVSFVNAVNTLDAKYPVVVFLTERSDSEKEIVYNYCLDNNITTICSFNEFNEIYTTDPTTKATTVYDLTEYME